MMVSQCWCESCSRSMRSSGPSQRSFCSTCWLHILSTKVSYEVMQWQILPSYVKSFKCKCVIFWSNSCKACSQYSWNCMIQAASLLLKYILFPWRDHRQCRVCVTCTRSDLLICVYQVFLFLTATVVSMGMVQQLVSVLRMPHSQFHEHVVGTLCW